MYNAKVLLNAYRAVVIFSRKHFDLACIKMIFLFGLLVKPNSPGEVHSGVPHKKKQASICKFVLKIGT